MRIYVIGFMASGKTTYGRELARRLNFRFVDLDNQIENTTRSSIPRIFEKWGEDYFRKIEHQELLKTLDLTNTVVSTGGGTPVYFDNMNVMNKAGITLFIKLSKQSLLDRILKSNRRRPLLEDKNYDQLKDYLDEAYSTRMIFYRKARLVINPIVFEPDKLAIYLNRYKQLN